MKLNSINSYYYINFKAKIIDSHGHVGSWKENDKLIDYTKDIDVFIKNTLDNGDTVEKILVSNLDCMAKNEKGDFLLDELNGNKNLLNLVNKNEKLAAMATCQPGYGNVNNIKKLIEENPKKFIGLKFHPEQLNLAANNKAYEPYMEFAAKEKLPCLFHSGSSNVSNPDHIYELAKKYPDVKVIMAHWGAEQGGNYDKVTEIIIESVKTKNSQIYADISWVDCNDSTKPTLKKIIKHLKKENALDRILFGSDAPLGRFGGNGENGVSPQKAYSNLIDDIKNMIKREFPDNESEEIIDKIFYKNSKNLFFEKEIPPETVVKNNKHLKVLIGSIIAAVGSYCLVRSYKNSKKQPDDEKSFSKVV